MKRKAKTNKVRHKGESVWGKMRGPNTGAHQSIWTGMTRFQGHRTQVSDPDRFVKSRNRGIMQ